MPGQPLFFLVDQVSSFLIHRLSLTHSYRPTLLPYPSLFSTCITKYFLPYVYLRRQRIFLGVGGILWISCPFSETKLTFHRKVLLGRLHLCVRANCWTLYQPLLFVLRPLLNILIRWKSLLLTTRPHNFSVIDILWG